MTPEGTVKKKIRALLDRFTPVHVSMPVQNGMGKQMLDFHCIVSGHALIIEAKAAGGKPTPRQEQTIAELQAAGATVLVVDGSDESMDRLLHELGRRAVRKPATEAEKKQADSRAKKTKVTLDDCAPD